MITSSYKTMYDMQEAVAKISKKEIQLLEDTLDQMAEACYAEYGFSTCNTKEKMKLIYVLLERLLVEQSMESAE